MEQRGRYLIVILPPMSEECLRRFLEALEEIRNKNTGGHHEPFYKTRR
jgi:hypothetical protein